MMASVNSVSQMANPAARRHRPSQPAVFSNDAALITATHSRPVQYSQDHAYGQEAPTPPPFLPRRRAEGWSSLIGLSGRFLPEQYGQ